jgi:precorrin-6B methylase 2
MKIRYFQLAILLLSTFICNSCRAQDTAANEDEESIDYIYKEGNPNGIGKWFMGREIAHVMGFQGINWLERSEREKEEQTSTLISNMQINATDVIADIGAGSGYHVFKMAKLANKGTIYAVDIQPEMLRAIQLKQQREPIQNIKTVKGTEQITNLPTNSVDKILMVDVYHEFSHPKEMLASIYTALKPNGKIFLIEYRMEDPKVPIKPIHKMTEKQAVKELEVSGFKLIENIDNLPWQHCMVFKKQ